MRLEAGAVELESAELRFQTDAQGQPTGVTVKQVGCTTVCVCVCVCVCLCVKEHIPATCLNRAPLLNTHTSRKSKPCKSWQK
jgi:hypothetical protein